MKINRLETHDRLLHFKKNQEINIYQGAEDCLKKNSLSLEIQEKSPYVYIFAHPRTADDGVNKRLLWQPRLSVPEVQTNSYLFRALSHTDIIEVCWILPPKELWSQYEKGNVTENNWALWSINQFKTNKEALGRPHPEDLPEEKTKMIMKQIVDDHLYSVRHQKMMSNLYGLA